MSAQTVLNNLSNISYVRFHLRGYFSGHDDCLYVMDWDHPVPEDVPEPISREDFLNGIGDTINDNWNIYHTTETFREIEDRVGCTSDYWVLEITFDNGTKPVCFCSSSVDSHTDNFDKLLDLMGVSWEDEYYFYGDDDDE